MAAAVTLACAAAYAQTQPLPSTPKASPTTDAYKAAAAPVTPKTATATPAPDLKASGSGKDDELKPRSRQDVQRPDKSGGRPLMPQGPLALPGAGGKPMTPQGPLAQPGAATPPSPTGGFK
jgi:hypothetical protein